MINWKSKLGPRSAPISTHKCVLIQLKHRRRSFEDLDPDNTFNDQHRMRISHFLAISQRCSQSFASTNGLEVLDPLHEYAGKVLNFFGRYWDEVKTREGQVNLVYERSGYNADHPLIARSLGNLSNAVKSLGNLEKVKTTLGECLEIYRSIFDPDVDHPSIATVLCSLGNLYESLGKEKDAESKHVECLRMQRRLYGDDAVYSEIAATLGNPGIVYRSLSKLEEAELKQRECLTMQRQIYGYESTRKPGQCLSITEQAGSGRINSSGMY